MSRISTRLTLLCAAIIGLSFVVVVLIFNASTSARFVEQEVERVSSAPDPQFEQFAADFQAVLRESGWAGVQSQEASVLSTDLEWIAVDNNLTVIASSVADLENAEAMRDTSGAIQLNSRSDPVGSQIELSWTEPFQLSNEQGFPVGWLLDLPQTSAEAAGANLTRVADVFASKVWRSAAVWLALILLLTVGAIGWVMKRSLLPIEHLKAAAHELQHGQIPAPLANPGTAEFDELVEAFNQATKAIGQTEDIRRTLIANIAHELRTPVTNLKAQLEALDAGLIPPGDCSDTLQAETRVLERLIDDFQQLAVADAGQLQLHTQDIPLRAAVEDIVMPLVDKHGANLLLDIPGSVVIHADIDRLYQVFGNLLENAERHRPDGLEIRISAKLLDDSVQIRFADNGPGIDARHRAYVFERFYRAEKSRNRSTGGSGLGLTIVREIVQAMGGEIRLSENNGVGTEFVLSLPGSNANKSHPGI